MLHACLLAGALMLPFSVHAANTAYVWTGSPTPTLPYTNWTTAAHTIQDAINAANAGDTVLVTNGVYATGGAFNNSPAMSNRVAIAKAITVQSVNGAAVTIIQGAPDPVTGGLGTNATRCAYLSAGLLTGFTLTNGYTRTDSDWNNQQGGGGAFVTSSGIVSNCVVTGCTAAHFGGGLDLFSGNAWNCVVIGNSAYDGGGLHLQYGGSAFNSLIYGNNAGNIGGGARISQSGTLVNCTVAGNSATNNGGGVYCYQGGTNLNSIIYFNTTNGVANNCTTNSATSIFAYCCTTPDPGGTGNTTSDPQFVNLAADNYHLASGSPCINHGLNAYAAGGADLDGGPRIVSGTVDFGAYEFTTPALTITNTVTSVPLDQGTIVLGGTNSYLAGQMTYNNAANGATGSFPAQTPWISTPINLFPGQNQITVSGTNYAGTIASASITITRQQPTVVYVSPGGANQPPFTDWASAATTIQTAVDAIAPGGTVWVTNGVYSTGAKVTPGSIYYSSNRVCITKNITLQSVNGPANTSIVGAGPFGATAIRCVYMSGGMLSGFTLTNGYTRSGDWTRDCSGGGVVLYGGASVSNCVITGCFAYDFGGGTFCYNGGTVNNCRIAGNTSRSLGDGGTGGGGVACYNAGTVTNCVITGNTANRSSRGGGAGGGVALNYGGTVSQCVISNNTASTSGGGGVQCNQGGTVTDSIICGNQSGYAGGGIRCDLGGATVRNCLLYGNTAGTGGPGGGIVVFNGGVTVQNCTITGNTTDSGIDGCGIYFDAAGIMQNCIVFGNLPTNAANILQGTATISYTCSPGLSGSGNITNNPVFVNPAANNYRLAAGSRCIDAGTNAYMPSATDLDGTPRPLDGDANGTAIVDMGCYEFASSVADTDGDGMPDGWELAHGLNPTVNDATNDPDGDGFTNLQEYIADTDPQNAASYFHILSVTNLPPLTVTFLSSASRVYSLCCTTNLSGAPWTVLAGQSNIAGTGTIMSLTDTNTVPPTRFYRVKVALPP